VTRLGGKLFKNIQLKGMIKNGKHILLERERYRGTWQEGEIFSVGSRKLISFYRRRETYHIRFTY
jgi:hypothetical protein